MPMIIKQAEEGTRDARLEEAEKRIWDLELDLRVKAEELAKTVDEAREIRCIASEMAEMLPETLEFLMNFGACERHRTCLNCKEPTDCLAARMEQVLRKWKEGPSHETQTP